MIFLLDFLLVLNFLIAYKKFKFMFSPPVLLGGGMLLASLVSSVYYYEWNMNDMLIMSLLILGMGPLLFTIFCCLFYKNIPFLYLPDLDLKSKMSNSSRKIEIVIIVAIILGFFCLKQKFEIILSTFGSDISFSRIQLLVRTEKSEILIPIYIKLVLSFNGMISYFSCWYLSYLIVNNIKNNYLKFVLSLQIVLVIAEAFTEGDKAHLFDPVFRFIVIYVLMLTSSRGSFKLPKPFLIKLICFFVLIALSLEGINLFLGRYSGGDNIDMLAQYCGAGIKNFDIFMHSPEQYMHDKTFGGSTFHDLYLDFGINVSHDLKFQWLNGHELGNIYTQYYSFYRDFGLIGVLIMTYVTACVSMFIYNKALFSLFRKGKLNTYVFLYVILCLPIFMSFFSSNITARFFCLGFIRNYVLFSLFISIFDKKIIKNNVRVRQL